MGTFWLIPYVALLLQALPQATLGTVQGTVVRGGSVDPLSEVRVTLKQETVLLTNLPPGGVLQAAPPVTAVSDDAGRWVLTKIPAGLYTISAEREGFSGAPTNPISLTVTGGETAEIRLSMIPGGIIRGRVLDSAGQLVPNATVQALTRVFHNGVASLQPVASRTTDDRGEYRLFGIPPGDYYISATPRPAIVRPTTATGTARDIRTFFPSAASIATAASVNLSVGAEMVAIDVILASRLQVRVSGRVVNDVSSRLPDGKAILHLVPRDLSIPDDPRSRNEISVQLRPMAAEFEIPNVEPGAYDLFAVIEGPQGPAVGKIAVNVIDRDVERVTVIVQSGATVRGSVTVDGKPDSASASAIGIQPMDSLTRVPVGFGPRPTSEEPGTFNFDGIPEGRFRLTSVLAQDLYVDDIVQNGQSVYDSGFDVRSGLSPDPLRVTIKSGAGTVEGIARDDAGAPLAGATVALVPDTRRSNPALYQSALTDGTGAFVLRSLTPGTYKIFAWQGAVAGTYYSREFLARFEEYGVAVAVSPGSRSRADITVSRKESR